MRAAVASQAGPVVQQSAIGLSNAIQGFKHGPRVSFSRAESPNPKPTRLDRRGEEEALFRPLPVLIPCPVTSCPLWPLTGSGRRPSPPQLAQGSSIPRSPLHESRNLWIWWHLW